MSKLSDFSDEEIIKEIKNRCLEDEVNDITDFSDDKIIEAIEDRRLEDEIDCNCDITDYEDREITGQVRARNMEPELFGDQYTHAKLCDLFGVNRHTPVKNVLKMLKSKLMASPETVKRWY